MDMDFDTITVTRHEDGSYTADQFPERVRISAALLVAAQPETITTTVKMQFTNGTAIYRVIGGLPGGEVLDLQRVLP